MVVYACNQKCKWPLIALCNRPLIALFSIGLCSSVFQVWYPPGMPLFMPVDKPLLGWFSKDCLVLTVIHSNSSSFSQFPIVEFSCPWCTVQNSYMCRDARDFSGFSRNSRKPIFLLSTAISLIHQLGVFFNATVWRGACLTLWLSKVKTESLIVN